MNPRHNSRNTARGHVSGRDGNSNDLQAQPARARGASQDAAEVARYIGQLTAELSRMAAGAKLDFLVYLLNMAHAESQLIARRTPSAAVGAEE